MAAHNPYNFNWDGNAVGKPVTLARVMDIEAGKHYRTIPFIHDDDGRGFHMRGRIKRRKSVSRPLAPVSKHGIMTT